MNRSVSAITVFSPSDVTDIEIEYSQPLKRGRTIFGEVVPFGRVWRTGANGNTTVFLSRDLEIAGGLLRSGKYALFTVPGPERWVVIFYSEFTNFGLPRKWDEGKEALAVEVPSYTFERTVEALTISIEQTSHFEGELQIAWDNTGVSVPFEMPLQRNALEEDELVTGGVSINDYYSATKFYYDSGDLPGALLRINAALDMNERKPYFYSRLKSLIEAKLGDREAALKSARQSLRDSKAAGNEYYVRLNEASISLWTRDRNGIFAEGLAR